MANLLFSIPAGDVPRFDEMYVISDLHLGGPPGFQIFNSGVELERLINNLRLSRPPESRVALLINGDFVDFLAERPAAHFDPVGAIEKLDRIAEDDYAFAPVFAALRNFAATKNRFLIINLGNHDLELALPWVREHLLGLLSGDDEAARGRITLAFDGAGYLCQVGKAKVLCVHGNEVDDWNVADYETIRRLGRDVVQGRPIDQWIPNAGSQLVIDVMNNIKSRYPFVDLLKPEMEAVIPTLLALAPDHRDKLYAIGLTARRLTWDKIKRATGFLGSEEYLVGRVVGALPASVMPDSGSAFGGDSGEVVSESERWKYAEALLDKAEDRMHRGVDPLSLIASDERGEFLGMSSAVMTYFRGAETSEVLREALEKLSDDRSFETDVEDDTYRSLDERIGNNCDFLIAGHTHLARALERKRGHGWYFNSGTWARLIKLEKSVLNDGGRFRQVFEAFKAGTMEALDTFPGLVVRRLNVVAVWSEGERTFGELRQVSTEPGEGFLPPALNQRFPRS